MKKLINHRCVDCGEITVIIATVAMKGRKLDGNIDIKFQDVGCAHVTPEQLMEIAQGMFP